MTADQNFTLTMFYKQWRDYQDKLKASIAPLTAEQFDLSAGPGLRSIGRNVAHIIGCRAGWFTYTMGEDGGERLDALAEVDEAELAARSGGELAQALDLTFDFMMSRISRWSDEDMRQTFEDEAGDGVKVQLSRAWIVYHVMEHDLHHGGEVSITLGMHGIPAEFTS